MTIGLCNTCHALLIIIHLYRAVHVVIVSSIYLIKTFSGNIQLKHTCDKQHTHTDIVLVSRSTSSLVFYTS